MALIWDIETNGLRGPGLTKIHCIVTKDTCSGDDKVRVYHGGPHITPVNSKISYLGSISEGIADLRNSYSLVGHNICAYDIPVIQDLARVDVRHKDTVTEDTLIMSQLFYPEIQGHSLEAWAERLNLPVQKIQNEDWSVLTTNMLDRCINDVLINEALYLHLKKEYDSFPGWRAGCLQREQQVARIHSDQVVHGVRFDIMRAAGYLSVLDRRCGELSKKILEDAPKRCVPYSKLPVKKPRMKNGLLSKVALDWFAGGRVPEIALREHPWASIDPIFQDPTLPDGLDYGAFSRITFEPVSLSSSTQVKELLLKLGWKPTEWNMKRLPDGSFLKTSPKLTEDSYESLPPGLGQDIAEYNILRHRRGFLLSPDKSKGALTQIRDDLRVPADAVTLGTPTSRYTHMGVVVNIPKANVDEEGNLIWYPNKQKVLFGTEMRSLFTVEKGHTMLGCDLSGIEARMLAHYCLDYRGGPEMRDRIISGDFHQHNADSWGVIRNLAKNGLYALMYGCGDAKLASTLEKPVSQGKKLKQQFWDANPAIAALIKDLENALAKNGGWIKGLDGRKIFIRDKRKLLNSLLQSGAAAVFKEWMCLTDNGVNHEQIRQVIAMHDETQHEVYGDEDLARFYGARLCGYALQAGKNLGVKVETSAEFKCGANWAITH